ncbi:malate dehydrogenase (NAD) [Raineyella antarctica]|uniref:Malate dehydrogenase n=1 Tax=Raineyella antarctica TaxID=1577474 RepID=A0A1G6H4Q3_9ACTN|nr:malate dehydrogenase [Raineyella antarctica]SDB89270.1 malate dehydrogenase (NAD) [Raineyella antarctica]
MSQAPVKVAVTGGAGHIAYSLLFRIIQGQLVGPDTPVELRLLEIAPAMKALEGVAMEIDDCASPLVSNIVMSDDPNVAFDGANICLLVGARPRGKGMNRSDLLAANGAIFAPQGQAINDHAADDVRILVTGNPANTNTLIARTHAPDVPATRFTSLMRLDHNRALSQLAKKTGAAVTDIRKLAVWGNHSDTQYPDITHATIAGRPAVEVVNDTNWMENEFIPTVAKRGGAIIDARGASSATSAANATADHMHDLLVGSPAGDWVTMGVTSDGSYGIPEGLICGMPCTTSNGEYEIVQGLEFSAFGKAKLAATIAELENERQAVHELGLV